MSNDGLRDATGIYVDFWWANPALAINRANAHKIGTGNIRFLAAANGSFPSSTVIQCPTDSGDPGKVAEIRS